MTYRSFDTGTWIDPWFEELEPMAKLAFIYFWTNDVCNQAGIYEISSKRIKFELGYPIDRVYSELEGKIYWNPDKNIVWVKNFFRRQCQSFTFAISALNSIKDDSFKLGMFVEYNQDLIKSFKDKNGKERIDLKGYGIDTLSIGYPTEQNSNRTEQNSTDTDPFACARELTEQFEKIWAVWPKKKSKNKAERVFAEIIPNEQLVEKMLSTIERAKTSAEWKTEKGRFIPYLDTWLDNGGWDDEYFPDDGTDGDHDGPEWANDIEKES